MRSALRTVDTKLQVWNGFGIIILFHGEEYARVCSMRKFVG